MLGAGPGAPQPRSGRYNVPGGVGLAERIHERAEELFCRAKKLVTDCGCPSGCPLCVGAADGAGAIRKRAAIGLFEAVLHAA